MAPSIRTYGKKRSALGSLRSRHRSQSSSDSSPARNLDYASQSVNTCCETMTQTAQSPDNVQPITLEMIASALLDDSISDLLEEEVVQQTEKDVLDTSTSAPLALEDTTPDIGERRIYSHSPSSSQDRTSSSGRGYRPGAPRIQKASPNNRFAKSSRPRRSSNSSPKRKDCSLTRPLASPLRNSANHSSYIIVKDTESVCLLPHNVMEGAPRILLSGEITEEMCAMVANPDDIQEKVCAMLAATDALKPSFSQPRQSPVPKMSRMPSRMLAKVSSAWDRLQVKSSTSASKPRAKLTKQPIQEEVDGPLTSHPVFISPILHRTPLIDAIEIRLNEGDNLNRKKVQQMVGGCVPRKPVANDGKALRSGRSVDDPFGEPALLHSPNVIENRANLKIMIGSNRTSLLIIDPFEAERGFDSNLEEGILSSSPVCASTPRIHLHRVQTPTTDDSLDGQCSKLQTQTSMEKMATDLTVYQSQEVVPLRKASSQSGHVRPLPNTDRIKVGLMRDKPSLDASTTKWTKKHPSPSKRDLEELERAFHCYSELKRRGIGEEADELAAHYTPSSRYLSPRDTNRMMAVREEGTKPVSVCADQSPARCQTRRPSDDLRGHIRLAPPYRPTMPQADETDELL
ncbi:hypothetical protein ACQKWADRAFT_325796 [Trichoderma austrokoningii]